jgi:molecular chaperone DnaK (HSP70)
LINYSDVTWKEPTWGYNADPLDKNTFSWFKLNLEADSDETETQRAFTVAYKDSPEARQFQERSEILKKTAETVTIDYLSCLWGYTVDHLKRYVRSFDEFQKNGSILVVLTVPAIWHDKTKLKMQNLAHAAGLPENIQIVTEPEAAALHVIRTQGEEGELKVSFSGFGIFIIENVY